MGWQNDLFGPPKYPKEFIYPPFSWPGQPLVPAYNRFQPRAPEVPKEDAAELKKELPRWMQEVNLEAEMMFDGPDLFQDPAVFKPKHNEDEGEIEYIEYEIDGEFFLFENIRRKTGKENKEEIPTPDWKNTANYERAYKGCLKTLQKLQSLRVEIEEIEPKPIEGIEEPKSIEEIEEPKSIEEIEELKSIEEIEELKSIEEIFRTSNDPKLPTDSSYAMGQQNSTVEFVLEFPYSKPAEIDPVILFNQYETNSDNLDLSAESPPYDRFEEKNNESSKTLELMTEPEVFIGTKMFSHTIDHTQSDEEWVMQDLLTQKKRNRRKRLNVFTISDKLYELDSNFATGLKNNHVKTCRLDSSSRDESIAIADSIVSYAYPLNQPTNVHEICLEEIKSENGSNSNSNDVMTNTGDKERQKLIPTKPVLECATEEKDKTYEARPKPRSFLRKVVDFLLCRRVNSNRPSKKKCAGIKNRSGFLNRITGKS